MINSVKNGFYRFGWLLPAYLPVAEVLGRAAFNILFYIHIIWALLSLHLVPKLQKIDWLVYGFLAIAFAASVAFMPDASNQIYSLEKYTKYLLHISVSLILLKSLQTIPSGLDKFLDALGRSAIVTILLVFALFIFKFTQSRLHGELLDVFVLNGRNAIPWLIPILLYQSWFQNKRNSYILAATLVLTLVFFEMYAQARTALLALIIATCIYYFYKLQMQLKTLILALTMSTVLIFSCNPAMLRGASVDDGVWGYLVKLTSGRSILWKQAIETPPSSELFGVGFSNIEGKKHVTKIQRGNSAEQVKHLHNMFLDCWYETGWFGLLAFIIFLCYHLFKIVKLINLSRSTHNLVGAMTLSSSFALLTFGLLSQGQGSNYLSIYLPVMFAIATFTLSTYKPQST